MSISVDYKRRDPKGWCGDPKRGAAMGRHSYHNLDPDSDVKLALRRVRLYGDYDSLGTYWGGGAGTLPLYWGYEYDGYFTRTTEKLFELELVSHDKRGDKRYLRATIKGLAALRQEKR